VDPELERTLFWFTGHPIVYFWLLPAYVSWYAILPRQAGGVLYCDTMARISFLFFLAFSIPVGVHHQFEDPGIGQSVKLMQAFLTFIVGHFHITVGSATALTFICVAYWLVPHLAGRPLWGRRVAQAQVWLWFGGMALFSATEHFLEHRSSNGSVTG
jgi:heme/copper-type cytochrome/quinol oxidase subunit 1